MKNAESNKEVESARARAACASTPDVSIVIVSWNTKRLLKDCLTSVVKETRGITYEIICVDNASTDGSAAMVRAEFPEVRLIKNIENRHFVAANNQAMAASSGRYVLLLNSDTMVLDNAIAKTVRFADSSQNAAIVGCKVLNPNLTLQYSCFMFPSVLNTLLNSTYLYKLLGGDRFFGRQLMTWWTHDEIKEVDAVAGCFVLARKEAIDEVGMMDQTFYFYGDDLDWCYRFRSVGWKVEYFPSASIIHYGGQSTRQLRSAHLLQRSGSTILFMRLHGTLVTYILTRVLVALGFLLRAPYWFLRELIVVGKRAPRLDTAVTYVRGAVYALFAWEKMMMNSQEIRYRLASLRGQGEMNKIRRAQNNRTKSFAKPQ